MSGQLSGQVPGRRRPAMRTELGGHSVGPSAVFPVGPRRQRTGDPIRYPLVPGVEASLGADGACVMGNSVELCDRFVYATTPR